MPGPGADSIINTYSAVSTDGIHYDFEPSARFDASQQKVIDPSAVIFNGIWHYTAPAGAPQAGAFHCISGDGIIFTRQLDYLSDAQHNWTGNYAVIQSNELRFYGSGPLIWYNSSPDGFNWNGYHNTNISGGDPAVVPLTQSYLMIYTGGAYVNSIYEKHISYHFYQDPPGSALHVKGVTNKFTDYILYESNGEKISSGILSENIDISYIPPGLYHLVISNGRSYYRYSFIKV
jgi:hypothetical protein